MKKFGYFCLILGILAFIGAASKGHSVFGPCFWIALGSFLLYRANNEQERKKETVKFEEIPTNEKPKQESLQDIQSQLTLQQREAAMCLIAFFGAYNHDMNDEAPMVIFKQAALFYGIPSSPAAFAAIMSKYTNADTLIDTVLTIRSVKAKEFLLLTCYDIIRSIDNLDAFELFLNIANDMGYDKTKLEELIRAYY